MARVELMRQQFTLTHSKKMQFFIRNCVSVQVTLDGRPPKAGLPKQAHVPRPRSPIEDDFELAVG